MRKFFKEFHYYEPGEKRGILLLVILIFIALIINIVHPLHSDKGRDAEQTKEEEQAFIAEIKVKKPQKDTIPKYNGKRYNKHSEKKRILQPVPFNPNEIDSALLDKMGLSRHAIKSIINYRKKGGKFRRPEDVQKMYGVSEEEYAQLKPYIQLPPKDTARTTATDRPPIEYPKTFKYPAGTVIELNSADTTELKKIPGIGSATARKIIAYRQKLGGFYQVEQLQDIQLDSQSLAAWFNIDSTAIKRINVNRSDVEQLRRHPYINFYQAKALVEYRDKNGDLISLKPFKLYEEFSAEDLQRIQQYICFTDEE